MFTLIYSQALISVNSLWGVGPTGRRLSLEGAERLGGEKNNFESRESCKSCLITSKLGEAGGGDERNR